MILAELKTAVILFISFALAVCIVTLLLKGLKGKGRTGAYRQRKLMTDNEAEFFGRLVVALPDHYVFPQVAMSALLEAASRNGKTAHADRLRIAQQRVDYVVCTKTCEVVAVVELDDRTHASAKDQVRDARLEQGGIRTVRFQSRTKPRVDVIRATILGALATATTPSSTAPVVTPASSLAAASKADAPA